MKILIIGYGKMGKMVEAMAVQQGHTIAAVVDAGDFWPRFDENSLPDVAIEFTQPDSVVDNLRHCVEMGIPVVTGTTGWDNRKAEIQSFCKQKNGSVLFASNFSIGVNMWFRMLKTVAADLARFEEYSAQIEETHHINKVDKPSGTAITAAEILLSKMKKYSGWSLKNEEDKLLIIAHRKQNVTGTHSVKFTSASDEIELIHKADNREGFAKGALQAALWLCDKKGFFHYADVFGEIFSIDNK